MSDLLPFKNKRGFLQRLKETKGCRFRIFRLQDTLLCNQRPYQRGAGGIFGAKNDAMACMTSSAPLCSEGPECSGGLPWTDPALKLMPGAHWWTRRLTVSERRPIMNK